MAKRPTPKQRHPHSRSGHRYGSYLRSEWRRLRGLARSPYARPAKKRKTIPVEGEVITVKA